MADNVVLITAAGSGMGAALQRLVDSAMSSFGRIDALVNSAGHGPKGELSEKAESLVQCDLSSYKPLI